MSLLFLAKRLRDKDEEIRKQTYLKLARCKITIEQFPSEEQRMMIIKEGLTDPSQGVREACSEFLKASMIIEEEKSFKMKEDLCYLFKVIDCKQIFIKEYYIQLPFILMRYVF